MSSFGILRAGAALVVSLSILLMACSGAYAAGGVRLCIPEAEGAATVTPTKGACAAGYKLDELGAEGKEGPAGKEGKEGTFAGLTSADKETLLAVLPYIKFVKEGIDKKSTIQFSGVNIQVLSGAAKEAELNGLGNLVIGLNEEPGTQTGSNNLVLGTIKQSFTSYGGLLAGQHNTTSGAGAAVGGGEHNYAKGSGASVSGGEYGTASGVRSSVSGGYDNLASDEGASVSGGQVNVASGLGSSVSGGIVNEASGTGSWVSGGAESKASGMFSSVSGGVLNSASGFGSSVLGGYENTASGNYAAILGGKGLKLPTEFGEDY
jgi:hypothetical protein